MGSVFLGGSFFGGLLVVVGWCFGWCVGWLVGWLVGWFPVGWFPTETGRANHELPFPRLGVVRVYAGQGVGSRGGLNGEHLRTQRQIQLQPKLGLILRRKSFVNDSFLGVCVSLQRCSCPFEVRSPRGVWDSALSSFILELSSKSDSRKR